MATWDSYTQKSTPADNDTLMIKDTSGGANKRTPFSGVWNWIVSKLASAVISQLETTNKSIIPAINELNSKFLKTSNPRDIDLNEMTTSGIYGTTDSSPSTVGWKNCPSNDTGYLKVELNATVLSQTYISYTGEIFFRAKYNHTSFEWSNWEKITMTPVSQ